MSTQRRGFSPGLRTFAHATGDVSKDVARKLAAPLLRLAYRSDLDYVRTVTNGYRVGHPDAMAVSATESWRRLARDVPGLHVLEGSDVDDLPDPPPFVYERPDAPYLREFCSRYHLPDLVARSRDEYDAMLRLGAWLGSRWDHGTDALPTPRDLCEPSAIVAAGERGAKYWCEIAARTAVHAATSLGWVARLTTESRDGRTWEHAVAELWSNQFAKWFALDTDFNVVHEGSGVPLSAFELCHHGERLRESRQLSVRPFAPPKASLAATDLLPFYRYIHVDMRNDWCSRRLRRGSPAGGDLATWWTARTDMARIITAKTRVDDAATFDWKVNVVSIHAVRGRRRGGGAVFLEVGVSGYSPVFEAFEVRADDRPWARVAGAEAQLTFAPGQHSVAGRLLTRSGHPGPESRIQFRVSG